MNVDMELRRRTWLAAVKLAAVLSIVAALVAVAASAVGEVPQIAIVLPVIVIAFTASWVQTGRVRRREHARSPLFPTRSITAPTA